MAQNESSSPKPVEKKPIPLVAAPIQAPFDDDLPSDVRAEERAPADPLEHFRKFQCGNGHGDTVRAEKKDKEGNVIQAAHWDGESHWDPAKIVFSMDNKRWMLRCRLCFDNKVPSWFTITGSALAISDQRVAAAPITK